MAIKGIDISNWQKGIDPTALGLDFAIVKATEGVGFTDPTFSTYASKLKSKGMLWGFYHFARENNASKEAEFFYGVIKPYLKQGIPVLDYEVYGKNANDVAWCEQFVKRFYELSGIYCMIYTSAAYIGRFSSSWIPSKCALWLAGYPQRYTTWPSSTVPYKSAPWKSVAIWQFTDALKLSGWSSGLDGDYAYIDRSEWMRLAGGSTTTQPSAPSGRKQKFIDRMLYWCDKANLGYDQSNRWDIRVGGECDCSSLVYWCLWEAGYGKKPANPYFQTLYTGTLQKDLLAMGFTKVPNNGNPQPGDVLLNDVNHVAVCTSPGKLSQASIDENGRAAGGKSGDQTGSETNTRTYYNYPWNAYYRPPAEAVATTPKKEKVYEVKPIHNNGGDIYRYYNSKTGEHFYCTAEEGKTLKAPWVKECKAFTAPAGGTVPIYRMYNPNTKLHLFTASYSEAASLEKAGWVLESVPFFGNPNGKGKKVYRLYNSKSGDHFLTTSEANKDQAVKESGYKVEGIAFYMN